MERYGPMLRGLILHFMIYSSNPISSLKYSELMNFLKIFIHLFLLKNILVSRDYDIVNCYQDQ